MLSRVEVITEAVTHDKLAAAQADDEELRALLVTTKALQIENVLIPRTTVELYCDTSSGKPRPYVPSPPRPQIFKYLHYFSHTGIKATAKIIYQCFVWPAIHKDNSTRTQACQPCLRSKVSRHTITPVGNLLHPPARFLHIHIDLVGPLLSSGVFQFCITAVDRYRRWP